MQILFKYLTVDDIYALCKVCLLFYATLHCRAIRNKRKKILKKREIFSSGYDITLSSNTFTYIYSQHLPSVRWSKRKIKIIDHKLHRLKHRENKRPYLLQQT